MNSERTPYTFDLIVIYQIILSFIQNKDIQKQVDKILQDNLNQNSHLSWSVPVNLVPKN